MKTKFMIYKEIEIEHPKSWSKKELMQFASDLCNINNRGWRLKNVNSRNIFEKVIEIK